MTVVAQLQQARPDMLGRVMAVFAVVLLGATVVSGPFAGWLAAAAGATAPFLLGAMAAALTAGILAVTVGPVIGDRGATDPTLRHPDR